MRDAPEQSLLVSSGAFSTTYAARLAASAVGQEVSMGVQHASRPRNRAKIARVTADPQSDITDVFTFTSPENPARVVLAMAVTPYASDASTFSPLVDYAFRVQLVQAVSPLTLDGIQHDVVCEFGTGVPQTVTCTAPSGP